MQGRVCCECCWAWAWGVASLAGTNTATVSLDRCAGNAEGRNGGRVGQRPRTFLVSARSVATGIIEGAGSCAFCVIILAFFVNARRGSFSRSRLPVCDNGYLRGCGSVSSVKCRAHSAHRGGHRAPGAGAAGRCVELIGAGRYPPRTRGVGDCQRALARWRGRPPPRRAAAPAAAPGRVPSRVVLAKRLASWRASCSRYTGPTNAKWKSSWKSYGYVVEIVETSPASNTPETYPSFGPTRGADSFKSTVVSRAGAGGALRSSRDAPTRRLCSRQCVWELARRVRIESERSFESMLTTARPYRIGTGVSDRSRAQAAPGAPLSRTGDSFSSFCMLAGALDRLA